MGGLIRVDRFNAWHINLWLVRACLTERGGLSSVVVGRGWWCWGCYWRRACP